MRNRHVLLFFFLLTFCCIVNSRRLRTRYAESVSDEPGGRSKLLPEKECSRVGGICLERKNCPPEKASQVGKCPRQIESGAVCCHSLAKGETGCRNLGGSCMDLCRETLKIHQARDCPASQFCCILI